MVRKIREEDEQEERLRRQKQEETRMELQNFAARQTEYRREEAERAAAELAEIEASPLRPGSILEGIICHLKRSKPFSGEVISEHPKHL